MAGVRALQQAAVGRRSERTGLRGDAAQLPGSVVVAGRLRSAQPQIHPQPDVERPRLLSQQLLRVRGLQGGR
jgi:hypothetical protein